MNNLPSTGFRSSPTPTCSGPLPLIRESSALFLPQGLCPSCSIRLQLSLLKAHTSRVAQSRIRCPVAIPTRT